MAACDPKSSQVAPGNPVQVSTGAPWNVSNLQLHSDLGVPYLAEQIRSIAQSLLYVSRCRESSSATWEVPRLLKRRVKTRQNLHDGTKFYLGLLPRWSFPNRGSLQLKRSQLLGSHPRSLESNSDQDQSPLCAVPIRVFRGFPWL